jgi:hypothetical protein
MTETQAKSGTAGAPTNPVDEEAGGAQAPGRSAVGRAAVPADPPSPKFTRAPGMPPPPDQSSGEQGSAATQAAGGGGATGVMPAVATPSDQDNNEQSAAATQARYQPPRPAGTGRLPGGNIVAPVGGPAVVGAARVTEAVRAARSAVSSAASRGPRRAKLNLKRIDPWSVMKFSFAVSMVLFIVLVVATSVLYLALNAMGVFTSINTSLTDLISAGGGQGASSLKITAQGVILTSALLGLVNVVLFTALATLGAFIYNVCADLVGGIELTLAERD